MDDDREGDAAAGHSDPSGHSAPSPDEQPLIGRLEHVHLGVADLDRSLAFYRDALGFRVRHEDRTATGRCAHVGDQHFYVALTERPGVQRSEPTAGRASIYHFGFTTPDLAALRTRLTRAGIEITDEIERSEGRSLYVHDPDGHEIEIIEYRPAYPFR